MMELLCAGVWRMGVFLWGWIFLIPSLGRGVVAGVVAGRGYRTINRFIKPLPAPSHRVGIALPYTRLI